MPIQSHPRDQAVQSMFDRIAGRYDLLNRVISFRFDNRWRAQAIQILLSNGAKLDIRSRHRYRRSRAQRCGVWRRVSTRVVGLDFSLEMLKVAQRKRQDMPRGEKTFFVQGSALAIPLKDTAFDGIMTAFVLRNVSDLAVFFSRSRAGSQPGGKCVSLDMFPPTNSWFSVLYSLYFYRFVPWIGGCSGGRSSRLSVFGRLGATISPSRKGLRNYS